jgi:hypothetical protein
VTGDGFFRADDDAPLQQGDIVLAPLVRLAVPDAAVPSRWPGFDQERHRFPFDAEPEFRPADALAGYGPVMVVTHDCHLDKEFLERYETLRRQGVRKTAALLAAENDPDLDRSIVVSPIIPVEAFRSTPDAIASQSVIGLFGIPRLALANLSASAVDVTFRATIDRHLVIRRLASLTEAARAALRFSLARSDAFRSPTTGYEIEAAVGKSTKEVRAVRGNPLLITLDLSDGSSLTLVQQPADIDQDGVSRARP